MSACKTGQVPCGHRKRQEKGKPQQSRGANRPVPFPALRSLRHRVAASFPPRRDEPKQLAIPPWPPRWSAGPASDPPWGGSCVPAPSPPPQQTLRPRRPASERGLSPLPPRWPRGRGWGSGRFPPSRRLWRTPVWWRTPAAALGASPQLLALPAPRGKGRNAGSYLEVSAVGSISSVVLPIVAVLRHSRRNLIRRCVCTFGGEAILALPFEQHTHACRN